MPAFPEFTYGPVVANQSQNLLSDPVHRAEFESGAYLTRTRSTAVPRTRTLTFEALSEQEKQELEDFERNAIGYGGDEFTWRDPNPNDTRTWNAKLLAPIEYNRHPSGVYWRATLAIALISEAT